MKDRSVQARQQPGSGTFVARTCRDEKFIIIFYWPKTIRFN